MKYNIGDKVYFLGASGEDTKANTKHKSPVVGGKYEVRRTANAQTLVCILALDHKYYWWVNAEDVALALEVEGHNKEAQMKEAKFKVGDKVKVVQSGWGFGVEHIGIEFVIKGEEWGNTLGEWRYDVSPVQPTHWYKPGAGSVWEPSFELVEEEAPPVFSSPKIEIKKVGSDVKIEVAGNITQKQIELILMALYN